MNSISNGVRELEDAGFMVIIDSTSPVKLHGGTSLSQGPGPSVFSGGFTITQIPSGYFEVNSTSNAKLDGTQHQMLISAIEAVISYRK